MAPQHRPPSVFELGLAVGVAALILFFAVIAGVRYRALWTADFLVPYTGGLILQQGHAAKLYDLTEQERVQNKFLNMPGVSPDLYPPFHAPLFALLARFGYRNAYLVWGLINVLLWVLFWYLLKDRPGMKKRPFWHVALISAFSPFWLALMLGQLSIVLLASLSLAFACLKRHRDFTAGCALGIGLLKLQVMVPFVSIFLLRRKWRLIAGLGAAAGVLGLVSLATVGLQGMASYANLLLATFRHPSNSAYIGIEPWNMSTIRGLAAGVLGRRIGQSWINALVMATSGSLIVLTAWLWDREERKRAGDTLDLMFAGAVVVALVTAPYLHHYDLTPMLLPIVLVLGSEEWAEKSKARAVLVMMILILYAAPFYMSTLFHHKLLYLVAPVLIAFVLATLALARQGARSAGRSGGASLSEATAVETNGVSVGQ